MSNFILYEHRPEDVWKRDTDYYQVFLFERLKSDEFFGIVVDGCVDHFLYIINDGNYGVKSIHCDDVIHMYVESNYKVRVFKKYRDEYHGHIIHIREICSLIASRKNKMIENDKKFNELIIELTSFNEDRIRDVNLDILANKLSDGNIRSKEVLKKLIAFRRVLLLNIETIEYIERNKTEKEVVVENNKEYL